MAAAIALARDQLTDDIIEILVAAILATEDLQSPGDDIRFNAGDLAGYASLVLASRGARARDKIIPTLCEILRHASQSLSNK